MTQTTTTVPGGLGRLTGHVLSDTGWVRGTVEFGERIVRIDGPAVATTQGAETYILPGFVDLHVHGGGGADVMAGGDAATAVARTHARHGTTALLATTVTASFDDTERALVALAGACSGRVPGGARVAGVHLEGPYISPGKLGAQPDFARPATVDEIGKLCALAPVRIVTLAPEIAGHGRAIQELVARGVRVQLGHTTASYDQGVAALAQGASGFTHLYNAMTGLHHRDPGIVGAAIAHAEYAEIIPDLLHVHPGAIRAALRAIPRLYGVTDATSATGMPDGDYRLGSHTVHKCPNGVRLADGTLAGSALTMDQALRNLASLGLSLEDASRRLSQYPAEYAGLSDRGRLAVGAWADIVVLDRELRVTAVFGEGEPLWPR
jgi:N-acetylglucosamine-6-phosphate deacetylase